MGGCAFELENENTANVSDLRRLREECIIALKVYDSCRQQDCLEYDVLGPARAAETKTIGNVIINEGDVIDPPDKEGIAKTLLKKYGHILAVPFDFIYDFIYVSAFFIKR